MNIPYHTACCIPGSLSRGVASECRTGCLRLVVVADRVGEDDIHDVQRKLELCGTGKAAVKQLRKVVPRQRWSFVRGRTSRVNGYAAKDAVLLYIL